MCILKLINKPWVILLTAITAVIILLSVMLVQKDEEDTLQLVHVYFNHGQSTASRDDTYTNDPYINETYYPFGRGQLTLEGKRTMYKVGSQLFSKYGDFLGEIYTNQIVYGVSSYDAPALTSLQTVLAVLFPPSAPYFIQTDLKWQPADFDYLEVEEDDMLAYWGKCEDALRELQTDLSASEQLEKLYTDFSDVYKYISQHSGESIRNAFDARNFLSIFNCQKNSGLTLPEWTNAVYPEPLRFLSNETWKAQMESFAGRKYAAGKLLSTIYKNSIERIQEKLAARKLYLYSGHTSGISGVLATLNIQHDYNLPYGSYIILELHRIDGVFGFKVFLQDHAFAERKFIKIGNCEEFCPLEQYRILTEQYYPNPDVCD